MNSPRSLEACRNLGILPESLYYIDFDTYIENNPDLIRYNKDIQQKRFKNINKYREDTIEKVKKEREKIIKEAERVKRELEKEKERQEKYGQDKSSPEKDKDEKKKGGKQTQILNLEKMLTDMKKKEEKDIEKIKKKQKNQVYTQVKTNIENQIILNKN